MRRLPIAYLIQIAEEQVDEANRALEAEELDAKEYVREWCQMLDALHIMKDRSVYHGHSRIAQRLARIPYLLR